LVIIVVLTESFALFHRILLKLVSSSDEPFTRFLFCQLLFDFVQINITIGHIDESLQLLCFGIILVEDVRCDKLFIIWLVSFLLVIKVEHVCVVASIWVLLSFLPCRQVLRFLLQAW
jgi:hypothetical protein